MTEPDPGLLEATTFVARCLSIDLEVGVRDARIHQFAAVRGDSGQSYLFRQGDLPAELTRLDRFAQGAHLLLGHNVIAFDAPHLEAVRPDLNLVRLPRLDTLRLNPLAFPRNPYHHLVKHYQDGQLRRGRLNDPELDARLTLRVLADQFQAFRDLNDTAPDLLLAWHWLTSATEREAAFDDLFRAIRGNLRPTDLEAKRAIERLMGQRGCTTHAREILQDARNQGWSLAYALAWLSVAEGNSVMPPWVRHQFPHAGTLVKLLRDTPCDEASCTWCRERHDARQELARFFGFGAFRPEPCDSQGRPLQQAIVEAAMRGSHVLGILPTGTGKSLCYQIPALSRYDKTGALTVVISPLVALMADQVAGLEARGITTCAAINGLLSMPERADVLDRVRLGDVGILIISPEQLRNRALRKVLSQREIGSWVLDEAHCISKWGHDFRPDYRYVGRFIKEKAGDGPVPAILCLTATAKPDVKEDIRSYFHERLGIDLQVFDGGAKRDNLEFSIQPTTPAEKLAHIHQALVHDLPPDAPGGAIVYCATRKRTEEVSAFLVEKGMAAGHFHAKLQPETKKSVQERFIRGELQVISATNAFGMGIDKPDVRLVIHADIPGSLENYLQEAGRAGRDREQARCVLLYTAEDVERQFGMSARSRLTQREIQSVLRALRNLDRKKRRNGEIVATSGEILAEEDEGVFERDRITDDTRVRTAISWLEEAHLLQREENQVQIFPSSLRVATLDEARAKLSKKEMTPEYRRQLLSLVEALITANADEGISTDELMGASGLSSEKLRAALYDLEHLGLASNDTALTAFVHDGVERSSRKRLAEASSLEEDLIAELREMAPDLSKGESSLLRLRAAAQNLRDKGHANARPEMIWRIVRGLANDGRREESGVPSLELRRLDAETVSVTLRREWSLIAETAEIRRSGARRLLDHLLSCLPAGSRGTDLLAETTLGQLIAAIQSDLLLSPKVKNPNLLMDRALLWLHEQEVLRLNKGMAVFRPAMTIQLGQERRPFVKADFAPLQLHYSEQIAQIHVMAEYVQRGLQRMADALLLAMEYFQLSREEFFGRWLPDRKGAELSRQTTPESWRTIVEDLGSRPQQDIVKDDREQTNVLVLAGPGSGKTRVLVHRIAYLVRVKREHPRGILALAYNRHAAVEIRRRLQDLIGDDAGGVTVLTCHALAMRLAGVTFEQRSRQVDHDLFRDCLRQAIALLKGEGLPPEEADEQREQLLAGFRWILVDEYQDIGPEQYELISALAGRTLQEDEGRLSLFAVGDDDQNIYAFDGASIAFIRRFEEDYSARPAFLTENYRSTAHVIEASNLLILPAKDRMKSEHPILQNKARKHEPPGGEWQQLDPVGKGRVQILPVEGTSLSQAAAVMAELERLAKLAPDWDWARCAVIAREWKFLDPLRAYCERASLPVQMADEDKVPFFHLRETQELVGWLRADQMKLLDPAILRRWLAERPEGTWWGLLREAVEAYTLETGGAELPAAHCIDWLVDWGREARRRQTGLMLLTAHRAKGLEFDHVVVLDGGWDRLSANEDPGAPRRLYYVAMTRARKTLTLARSVRGHELLDALPASPAVFHREALHHPAPPLELGHRHERLSLKDVDMGFAGRHAPSDPIHGALQALQPGDSLSMRTTVEPWELQDSRGRTVGRLAAKYAPPAGHSFLSGRVMAVTVRRREETAADYLKSVRSDRWEVVLPELVFAPTVNTPAPPRV